MLNLNVLLLAALNKVRVSVSLFITAIKPVPAGPNNPAVSAKDVEVTEQVKFIAAESPDAKGNEISKVLPFVFVGTSTSPRAWTRLPIFVYLPEDEVKVKLFSAGVQVPSS